MANDRSNVATVKYLLCWIKQKVHVAVRPGAAEMVDQTILRIQCNNTFKVTAPDKIIRGPFPV
jgi:hypothetical protein